jgi:hypothetical protein
MTRAWLTPMVRYLAPLVLLLLLLSMSGCAVVGGIFKAGVWVGVLSVVVVVGLLLWGISRLVRSK